MKQVLWKLLIAALLVTALGATTAFTVAKPLKLKGMGTLTFITDSAGNVVGGTLAAKGHATHLGRWRQSGTLAFSPHPTNPTLILASGDTVFMVANGDELNATMTDAVLDTTTGIATGSFNFAGGTGRFRNAVGRAPFTVTQDLAAGTFTVSAYGTINY